MNAWHVTEADAEAYARRPEEVAPATASSIEQHLLGCDTCRDRIAGAAPAAMLASSWERVASVIDEPRRSAVERTLGRFVPDASARLVAATPGLQVAWLAAVVVLSLVVGQLSRMSSDPGIFLVCAPLVPVVAVMITFAPVGEPGGEASVVTPAFGAGLLLRRVVAASIPTVAVLAIAGAVVADVGADASMWLLPGLALTTLALALSTWVRPAVAASTAGGVWLLVLGAAVSTEDVLSWARLSDAAVFDPLGQWVAGLVAVGAVVVVVWRRDRFSTMEVVW